MRRCWVEATYDIFFRAAAAHNLPVMCQAVALGADLEWRFVCNWIGAMSVQIANFCRNGRT